MPSYKLPSSQVIRMFAEEKKSTSETDDLLYDTLREISQAIREFRKENNITNKELADMCGITTSVMSRLESGYQNIALKTVCKVLVVINKKIKIEDKK